MEKVLYNTVLGAKPIRTDGSSFYYSDYHDSGFKTYRREVEGAVDEWDRDGRWPCCSGTLPQIVGDYAISTYFRARDGVYVTLYVPSRLNWSTGSITQETAYPTENLVTGKLATAWNWTWIKSPPRSPLIAKHTPAKTPTRVAILRALSYTPW